MTLAELKQTFLEEIGERDHTRFTESMVKRWLNEGAREFATRSECIQKSSTLSISDRSTTLPADVVKVVGLKLYNGGRYTTCYRGYDGDVEEELGTGIPQVYVIWNDKLVVTPSPSETYTGTLRYIAYPTPMSADSDSPVGIPEIFQNALVLYAVAKAFVFDEKADKATYYRKEFDQQVMALAMDVTNRKGLEVISD